jgi:hypothetical protein
VGPCANRVTGGDGRRSSEPISSYEDDIVVEVGSEVTDELMSSVFSIEFTSDTVSSYIPC